MSALTLEVVTIDDHVPGIRTLSLARADRGVLPSFTPGSHIVIQWAGGANAYSLTGETAAPREYVVSVLECPQGRGGSRWIHRELRVGSTIHTHLPRSAFAPVLRASRHLLVAAGIGITPMISHLRSARRWGRDVRLLYIHREGRGAYVDEIASLTDHASFFTDRAAFLHELKAALAGQPFGTHLYLCGPSQFIDDVVVAATDLGWRASRIHVEHFGGELAPGDPFEVELASSGDVFTVESGVSLLESLTAHGHNVPSLCHQGVCGECRVPVLAGEVLHRDLYLTAEQRRDSMMACVSRGTGRVELDL
ncbi:ferredoxin-NADP reductase [Mycolicibacterium sp. BK556]|uniref:PDR/VanB family oxidoreductase n=1 Tax=Mycobacteriaceae TaxID=1762 RepID=UPI00106030AC|nr:MULTISPECIES: PDR/VanB family oxidoreductase [Mycobacteriaceae]MBB3604600.1 ferredoxin-NADP reductase [Mycolicibacterium sp. BK556]MBB3634687.1 ferredoxin-NADP reductase [Mycolicibacterium sp. BK607]MBB3752263.1 ferredoxin-NADP reductase [Mycolicibacterium sp. BK634]TDO17490.1 ferredoxin-NADP reductase [Mycobacterium sp. BK086]